MKVLEVQTRYFFRLQAKLVHREYSAGHTNIVM